MDTIIEAVSSGTNIDQALETFLALSHTEKVSLLITIGGLKDEKAGLYLNLLYPRVADKDVRKLIKKTLFRLKTLGIHVEEPVAPGKPALHKIEALREEKAFLSNYDGEGLRVTLIAAEARRNQFFFVHSTTHYSEGLVDLAGAAVPRRELENLLADYRRRVHGSIVLPSVSPSYAAYLIREGGDFSRRFESKLAEIRPFLSSFRGQPQKPEDLYHLEAPDGTVAAPIERILQQSAFEPLELSWDTIEEDRKAFGEAANPALFLPPHMVQERKGTFVEQLLAKEKMLSLQRSLVRMLEDYAYLFYCLKEFEYYRGLVEGLSEEKGRKGLMLFFIQKALTRKEPEQPGVLVNPYDPQPRRTR